MNDCPLTRKRPGGGGAVVFWVLIVLGVGAFTPCVLLPEWRAYEALSLAEQAEAHRLASVQREVAHHQRLLEAMRSDPAVVARFAQRDLNFQRPGEQAIAVDVAEIEVGAGEEFVPKAVTPPAWVARWTRRLPDFPYDAVFCDAETRPWVMVLSVGLIGVALVLFRRTGSDGESGESSHSATT